MKNINTLFRATALRLASVATDYTHKCCRQPLMGKSVMKNLIWVIAISGFLFTGSLKSQTVCDSLQVDSVHVQSGYLSIYFSNASQHSIVYPLLVVTLSPNPYLTVSGNPAISSFLDVAGGFNNGVTEFLPTLTQTTPANLVPLNTLFVGTASMYDPNDSSFFCLFQFSFTYGTLTGNAIDEGDTQLNSMSVYPNPATDRINVSLSGDVVQNASITITNALGEIVFAESNFMNNNNSVGELINIEKFAPGIYVLAVTSGGSRASTRFIKE